MQNLERGDSGVSDFDKTVFSGYHMYPESKRVGETSEPIDDLDLFMGFKALLLDDSTPIKVRGSVIWNQQRIIDTQDRYERYFLSGVSSARPEEISEVYIMKIGANHYTRFSHEGREDKVIDPSVPSDEPFDYSSVIADIAMAPVVER